jgi:hypothetical protein
MDDGTDLQRLVGRVLLKVANGKWDEHTKIPEGARVYGGVHNQNDDTITFHCKNGDYVFVADGDCCSTTYIDSIEGPKAGKIIQVLEPGWCEEGERYRTEENGERKFYKVTLVIEGKGHLDIEYRNESNGYYGGSLELASSPIECRRHADCRVDPELGAACAAREGLTLKETLEHRLYSEDEIVGVEQ